MTRLDRSRHSGSDRTAEPTIFRQVFASNIFLCHANLIMNDEMGEGVPMAFSGELLGLELVPAMLRGHNIQK